LANSTKETSEDEAEDEEEAVFILAELEGGIDGEEVLDTVDPVE